MELYKLLNLFKNEMKQPRILLSSLWTLFLCVFLSCSIVKADPFSVPVTYPYIPAVILSEVKISGQYAEAGDQVAAYVDSELRGVSSVIVSDGKAYVSLMVNVNGASEEATFKIYDASSESILNLTLDGATSASVIVPVTVPTSCLVNKKLIPDVIPPSVTVIRSAESKSVLLS